MRKQKYFGIPEKWELGPRASIGWTHNVLVGPGTPKCSSGTRDPGPIKWEPEPRAPKYLSRPLICYSFHCFSFTLLDLNTLQVTCYKTLH